jgi:RNA polymerase sigma factor (sigma-70 family)
MDAGSGNGSSTIELLAVIRTGDPAAASSAFVTLAKITLNALAQRVTGKYGTYDDDSHQEALLACWKKLRHTTVTEAQLEAWAYNWMRQAVLTRYRHDHRKSATPPEGIAIDAAELTAATEERDGFEELLGLATLSSLERLCCQCTYRYALTREETAKALNTKPGTVRDALRRVRRKLRGCLPEDY